jgi:hypothetical protein
MKRVLSSAAIAALIALQGCSEATGPRTMRVWGDVSFNGKPVEEGSITFEPTEDAAPAQGQIKAGHYDIPAESGPVADKAYLVRINAPVKTGKTIPNIMGDGAPTMDVMAESIPSMFNAKSSMKKTISREADKNNFHFKLMPSGAFE